MDMYVLTVEGKKRTYVTRVFRLKDLHPPTPKDANMDTPPATFYLILSRTELIRRFNAHICEYCGTKEGPHQVHHIQKMKDVANGKATWQKLMAARNRKTLILCVHCHQLLHAGKLPDQRYLKARESREPCASNGASTVRQEGDG